MPGEWYPGAYERLSDPQYRWGLAVLERIPLRGDETVVDAGCGAGRLTAVLLERLPQGRVIGVDRSQNMLDQAALRLGPRYGERVELVRADLGAFALGRVADLVVSTATFHWVLDHERLFRELFAALRPGGRLVAQCGGVGNLSRLLARARERMAREPLASYFAGWREPWEFADAETTARRLGSAGFVDVATGIQDEPTEFADPSVFEQFLTHVVFGSHLERLPSGELKRGFIAPLVELAARDDPPRVLDYRRLNLRARRPA